MRTESFQPRRLRPVLGFEFDLLRHAAVVTFAAPVSAPHDDARRSSVVKTVKGGSSAPTPGDELARVHVDPPVGPREARLLGVQSASPEFTP